MLLKSLHANIKIKFEQIINWRDIKRKQISIIDTSSKNIILRLRDELSMKTIKKNYFHIKYTSFKCFF